jgi:hypothetical protein
MIWKIRSRCLWKTTHTHTHTHADNVTCEHAFQPNITQLAFVWIGSNYGLHDRWSTCWIVLDEPVAAEVEEQEEEAEEEEEKHGDEKRQVFEY